MASQAKVSRIALNQILFATDFSSASESALRYAVALAKRYESTLHIVHVLPTVVPTVVGDGYPVGDVAVLRNAEQSMAQLMALEEVRTVPHKVAMDSADPGEAIVRHAAHDHIDLIVMGTHGYGGTDKLFLGSTAEKVIRHAACPVLTRGPHALVPASDRFEHILYATDFFAGSSQALVYAVALAEEDRADLTLLHVIESHPGSQDELLRWRHQDREHLSRMLPPDAHLDRQPEFDIERGTPHEEILRLAEIKGADLIVMGSHYGGRAATHVPWTTLHHVLSLARCPVLTVRGE